MSLVSGPGSATQWISSFIKAFAAADVSNKLGGPFGDEPAWDEPLVGFASGDDQIFEVFKEAVGPVHWTPEEIFRLTFPSSIVEAADLSVISWVLPQTTLTKKDNSKNRSTPSERWVRSRTFGEQFNEALKKQVETTLADAGYEAVSPALSPLWMRFDKVTGDYVSTWSERHVAHAAGLGTFGLCDGLITPAGKAVRLGSAVVRLRLDPTSRSYKTWHEYCPFLENGKCGVCIQRCPAGAISGRGHDKKKCAAYCRPFLTNFIKENFGFDGVGCGLCQTGVPCESGIPDNCLFE
ncbi:MAG: hypothetical protein RQ767_03790 [Thermovirgaceae bacterium]|nr:hypothetical protein [Thermovirgaceae bacterium]